MNFIDEKIFVWYKIRCILIDLIKIFPMEPSEFKNTIRIQKYRFSQKLWWKNFWKLTKLLPCGNDHSFQTIKDINSKFWQHKLQSWIKIVLISLSNKPSKSVMVGSGRFIILSDSAGLKMVIHIYLTFFRFFLKVLEPI